MEKARVAGRGWLWLRFLAGLIYLAILAVLLSAAAETNIALAFAALLAGAVVSTVLGLTWLTLWARREESQLGQFQIGSFFFLTALIAMLFAAARWTAGRIVTQHHAAADSDALFVTVTAVWLIAAAVSAPFLLGMAEAVMWAGVWAIRQPVVHRGIRFLWSTSKRQSRDPAAVRENSAGAEPRRR